MSDGGFTKHGTDPNLIMNDIDDLMRSIKICSADELSGAVHCMHRQCIIYMRKRGTWHRFVALRKAHHDSISMLVVVLVVDDFYAEPCLGVHRLLIFMCFYFGKNRLEQKTTKNVVAIEKQLCQSNTANCDVDGL